MNVRPSPLDLTANDTQNQRQHPRYKLPIDARIAGRSFRVADWSIAGVGLLDADAGFVVGRDVEVELILPLRGCSVSVAVKAQVRYRNSERRVGLQFVDISHEQVAMLQFAIDEYLSGRLTDADGILEFAMHNPQTKSRGSSDVTVAESRSQRVKDGATRAIGLSLAALIGLGALALIVSSLYNHLFVFEAVSAQVAVPSFQADSPVAGTVVSITDSKSIAANQELFRVRETSGTVTPVPAPCDCIVVSRNANPGNFIVAGAPVVGLAVNDAKPAVAARIPFAMLGRIYGGATVTLTYIDGVSVKQNTNAIEFPSLVGQPGMLIDIRIPTGRQLTAESVGQPVAVSFDTFKLPFTR